MSAPTGSKWKIVLRANGTGEVEVDGVRIPAIRSISVQGEARNNPTVTITSLPGELEIEVETPPEQCACGAHAAAGIQPGQAGHSPWCPARAKP